MVGLESCAKGGGPFRWYGLERGIFIGLNPTETLWNSSDQYPKLGTNSCQAMKSGSFGAPLYATYPENASGLPVSNSCVY